MYLVEFLPQSQQWVKFSSPEFSVKFLSTGLTSHENFQLRYDQTADCALAASIDVGRETKERWRIMFR